jgi:hypothetical protein
MAKVKLVALGTVRDGLGWDTSAHDFDVEGTTVADALRTVTLEDGRSLLEFLTTEQGEMKPDYMIHLDGGCVRRRAGLDTELGDEAHLLTMDIVRFIAGG